MSLIESELIINKAFAHGDIKHQLDKYEIEFEVLHEEFSNIQYNQMNKIGYSNGNFNSIEKQNAIIYLKIK